MPTITKSYHDDGRSVNRDGIAYPDHDSEMDFGVVKQLVLASKGLLAGTTFDDADLQQRPFRRLKSLFEAVDGKIEVVKGIHQRLENPHITFKMAGDEANPEYEFHLELSAERVDRTFSDGSPVAVFVWKAVKLSLFAAARLDGPKTYASHPVGEVARTRYRARGYSITEGQIEAHVKRVDDELAAKAEAARLENERIEKERLEMEAATRLALAKTDDNFPSLMGSPATVSGPKPVRQPFGAKGKGKSCVKTKVFVYGQ